MKKFLIAANAVLAFFLMLSLWGAFFSGEKTTLEIGKKKSQRKTTSLKNNTESAVKKVILPDSKAAVASIVRKNIFDPQRSGGMTGGRGGTATYSLVGFYKVNQAQGAVIMSKGRGRSNQPVKQYFKVGEVLPNGYTLSSISGNQAILSRGDSRITLNMAQASENNTVRRTVRRNTNPMQQMLNLMQQSVGMQQRQQMNMMRLLQQNNQNNTNRSRGSTNSRRSR